MNNLKVRLVQFGTGVSLTAFSVASFAVDDVATKIAAAETLAKTNSGLVAGAVITVCAVSFGLGIISSWLRK